MLLSIARGACIIACYVFLWNTNETRAQEPAPDNSFQVQQHRVGKSSVIVELRESIDRSMIAIVGLKTLDDLRTLTEVQLKQLFVVRVHAATVEATLPAVLGTYTLTDSEFQFVSRFPLSTSVKYHVQLSTRLTDDEVTELFVAPRGKPLSSAPTVKAIYPSSDVLPENLLKFYIHFSAPMSRGEAYTRIHLMQAGVEVPDPFLELGEELWDIEQTRFTLFIHPGRIKRGVKPREDSGLPMTDG